MKSNKILQLQDDTNIINTIKHVFKKYTADTFCKAVET